jgi:enediyne biosynthesis protein E4
LYGDKLKTGAVVEANTLASMAFLHRGDHFEVCPLPSEAQWAPAFGVCIADFDGDGAEDVFLSQNFFAVRPDDWRQDVGRGLLLKGDGHGGLRPVSGQDSGIAVHGEQRGCAASDYDGDGRLDLAVSQNGNATKLYGNRNAIPGLRVRVAGSPGNPLAAGTVLRSKSGAQLGPAREIQCGSGYWSQNSPVQVLSLAAVPSHLQVRWPGGHTTESAIPPGAREISISADGSVRVLK